MKSNIFTIRANALTEDDFGYRFCKDGIFKASIEYTDKPLAWIHKYGPVAINTYKTIGIQYASDFKDGSYEIDDIDNPKFKYINLTTKGTYYDDFNTKFKSSLLKNTYILTKKLKLTNFIKEIRTKLFVKDIGELVENFENICLNREGSTSFQMQKKLFRTISKAKIRSGTELKNELCDLWLKANEKAVINQILISDFIEITDNEALDLFFKKTHYDWLDERDLIHNSIEKINSVDENDTIYLGKLSKDDIISKDNFFLYVGDTCSSVHARLNLNKEFDSASIEIIKFVDLREVIGTKSISYPDINYNLNYINTLKEKFNKEKDENLSLSNITYDEGLEIVNTIYTALPSVMLIPELKTIQWSSIFSSASSNIYINSDSKKNQDHITTYSIAYSGSYDSHSALDELGFTIQNFFSKSKELRDINHLINPKDSIDTKIDNLAIAIERIYNILKKDIRKHTKFLLNIESSKLDRPYIVLEKLHAIHSETPICWDHFNDIILDPAIVNLYHFDKIKDFIFKSLLIADIELCIEDSTFINFNNNKPYFRPRDIFANILRNGGKLVLKLMRSQYDK